MEYFLVNPIKKWSYGGACKYYQRRNEEIQITLSKVKNDLKHIANNDSSNDFRRKKKAEYILINWKNWIGNVKTIRNGSECKEDNSENPAQPQVNEDQYQYDTIITAGKLLDEIIPMKLPKEVGEYLVQARQILWKISSNKNINLNLLITDNLNPSVKENGLSKNAAIGKKQFIRCLICGKSGDFGCFCSNTYNFTSINNNNKRPLRWITDETTVKSKQRKL